MFEIPLIREFLSYICGIGRTRTYACKTKQKHSKLTHLKQMLKLLEKE